MSSQLLVEMPAQSAARLLTLSLLEQLPQYGSALASADPRQLSRYIAAYRSVVRLLVMAEALHDGVARALRELAATWQPLEVDRLASDIAAIAGRLRS